MIDGSRFNRLPNSLTVIPPYSRAIYTSIDLVFTHCRCRPACTSVLASAPCCSAIAFNKAESSTRIQETDAEDFSGWLLRLSGCAKCREQGA